MDRIRWIAGYHDKRSARGIMSRSLENFIQPKRGHRGLALDIGCGVFMESSYLVEHGFSVLAIDSTPEVRHYLDRLAPEISDHIIFIQSGIEEFECQTGFSLILALNILPFCPLEHLERVMTNIKGWLEHGGRFVTTVFGPEDVRVTEGGAMSFTQEQLLEYFSTGYKLVYVNEYKQSVNNDPRHVIEMIVEKL